MNFLPDIHFYKFRFYLCALEDMKLPKYKGSMFRGAFGWAFRNSVCITKQQQCTGCMLQQQCSYFKIFETEVPDNNIWFLKRVKKVPHPFIIHPPKEEKEFYKKGEMLKVELTIFGDAVNYFPFFVYTFFKMGEQGISVNRSKFEVTGVTNITNTGEEIDLYSSEKKYLTTEYRKITRDNLLERSYDFSGSVKLNFVTPVRFQVEGKLLTRRGQINPIVLLNAIERRYYSLAHLFCGQPFPDYPWLPEENEVKIEENNLSFYDWERFSSRQDRKISLGGLIGDFRLTGSFDKLISFLLIGEKINIGKNTIFGLGEYILEK